MFREFIALILWSASQSRDRQWLLEFGSVGVDVSAQRIPVDDTMETEAQQSALSSMLPPASQTGLDESEGQQYSCQLTRPKELIMPDSVIPASHLDLFKKKVFANLATLMPGGQPQVTPVWVDYNGNQVLINTAQGRQKDKNLQRDGRVALSIMDPDNPYRYLEVRGHVVERTIDGADQHIDALAKKYLGQDRYPYRQPGEVRVLYKVKPDHTTSAM